VCSRVGSVTRRKIDSIPGQLHSLHVRLHVIMHFTNSLHSYLMNKAAFCDWDGLLESLQHCSTLQEVISRHDGFVDELRKSMLLSDVWAELLLMLLLPLRWQLVCLTSCHAQSRLHAGSLLSFPGALCACFLTVYEDGTTRN
jgi:hypothetical protein